MQTSLPFHNDWDKIRALLPAGREEAARTHQALVRRRQIQTPDTLLRLALVYAWGDLSLRNTVAWAEQAGVATLSDVALLERLQKAHAWLGWLLARTLQAQLPQACWPALACRVRLVDATALAQPGSAGTDWRVHLGLNLTRQTADFIEVTDAAEGETLARVPVEAGDLLMADRGYAHRTGIASVVARDAHVLVRVAAHNLPLQRPDGTAFDLLAALRTLPPGAAGAWEVQTAEGARPATPAVPGRLIALRHHPAQAEAARRRLRQTARRKGRQVQEATLEYAEYILLFTTLPEAALSAAGALALYRFRWQIECGFKRLKSLLDLEGLRAIEPRLCRTYLYSKLLGALLVERLASSWAAFPPWGEAGAPLDLAGMAAAVGEPVPGAGVRVAPRLLGGGPALPAPRGLRPAA